VEASEMTLIILIKNKRYILQLMFSNIILLYDV